MDLHLTRKPIRVAQIMGKMVGGGIESVVLNYYTHLDLDCIQFDFIVDADSTHVPRETIEGKGGRVFVVPPYQKLAQYSNAIENLLRKRNYLIVHSHMNALSVFPLRAAKKAGIPVRIAHSHSTSNPSEFSRNVLKGLLKTQANRFPTHRLACTKHAGEWLFGKHAQFDILTNAIDLNRFVYNPHVRNAIRYELGIPSDAFVIGHLGRFMPQKNHEFIVDVFSEVLKRRAESLLVLAGEGKLLGDTISRVHDLGIDSRVLFLGQRNDAEALYQAFDVFILPSLYEGLGLVAIEAQATGLDCYVSNNVPEDVRQSDGLTFIGLDEKDRWVDSLVRHTVSQRETGSLPPLYDISLQAGRLTEYYASIVKEVQ